MTQKNKNNNSNRPSNQNPTNQNPTATDPNVETTIYSQFANALADNAQSRQDDGSPDILAQMASLIAPPTRAMNLRSLPRFESLDEMVDFPDDDVEINSNPQTSVNPSLGNRLGSQQNNRGRK